MTDAAASAPSAAVAQAAAAGLVLVQTAQGLALALPGRRLKPLRVDLAARLAAHQGGAQGLLRAVGRARRVVDASAGLLGDALRLARAGCAVLAIERHPVVAALAADGLARFAAGGGRLAGTLELRVGEAARILAELPAAAAPEVVYFDPMFPAARAGAARRELALLRALAGDDADAAATVAVARQVALRRVVVKRPRRAPPLAGDVDYAIPGRTVRFDVYLARP